MRIAIIGAGVSGLVSAYLVCRDHDIVVKLIEPFKDKIRTSCPVTSVSRKNGRVGVRDGTGGVDTFDRCILAAHGDQALAMLSDPTEAERKILGAILYQKNRRKNNTFYCDAYWGCGFHEDGVKSALAVCEAFGKSL